MLQLAASSFPYGKRQHHKVGCSHLPQLYLTLFRSTHAPDLYFLLKSCYHSRGNGQL